MIGRSLGGLFAAQGLYLTAGIGMIWALRTFRTWADALRFLGLAYLLGVAGVGVAATLVLVAGLGVGTPVVVVLSLACFGVGAAIARLRGHGLPRVGGFRRPALTPESLLAGALALLTAAILVAFYRAARHQGLVAWDAWAFWVPKAKAIYFFGGLDEQLFRTLPGPSYPLFVPAVQAIDFHFMGSADQTTLALQYWFLFVGFVLAVWGLLRPLVAPVLIWPVLALVSV